MIGLHQFQCQVQIQPLVSCLIDDGYHRRAARHGNLGRQDSVVGGLAGGRGSTTPAARREGRHVTKHLPPCSFAGNVPRDPGHAAGRPSPAEQQTLADYQRGVGCGTGPSPGWGAASLLGPGSGARPPGLGTGALAPSEDLGKGVCKGVFMVSSGITGRT